MDIQKFIESLSTIEHVELRNALNRSEELSQFELTAKEKLLIDENKIIMAVKSIKTRLPHLSLRDAKTFCDVYKLNRIKKKVKTFKLTKQIKYCMYDAMRRNRISYHCYNTHDFFGAGFPSDYNQGVDAGLFRPYGERKPRMAGFYTLTPWGVLVVKSLEVLLNGFDVEMIPDMVVSRMPNKIDIEY